MRYVQFATAAAPALMATAIKFKNPLKLHLGCNGSSCQPADDRDCMNFKNLNLDWGENHRKRGAQYIGRFRRAGCGFSLSLSISGSLSLYLSLYPHTHAHTHTHTHALLSRIHSHTPLTVPDMTGLFQYFRTKNSNLAMSWQWSDVCLDV